MRTADLIEGLILERLGGGSASHLILLVSVRRGLNTMPFKGDLSGAVESALRRLMLAGSICQDDGIYSLGR